MWVENRRPGHVQISDEEEIARVTPVIEALKKEFDIPISIDTYKAMWQKRHFRREQTL